MDEKDDSMTLAVWIDLEQDSLVEHFPDFQPEIERYRAHVATLINAAIEAYGYKDKEKIFGALCPSLKRTNKENKFELPPEIIRYVTMLSGLARRQMETDDILLSKVPPGVELDLSEEGKPATDEKVVMIASEESEQPK